MATIFLILIERRYRIGKLTSEVKKQKSRAKILASRVSQLERDGVTGVLHRSVWEKKVLERLQNSAQIICLIDLNKFKQINDSFGHQAGDLVLQVFVKSLECNLRRVDLIGRYGGDEFVVAFKASDNLLTNKKLLTQIFIRVQKQFASQVSVRFRDKYKLLVSPLVSFSYGAVYMEKERQDLLDHIRLADKKLYAQKKRGILSRN